MVIETENVLTKQHFNLDEVLELQFDNDIQIHLGDVFDADGNPHSEYICYIDGEPYGTAATPMYALTKAVQLFKYVETLTNDGDVKTDI
jgi:hypothetical protein